MRENRILPRRKYTSTFIALMGCLAATFFLAHIDLGLFSLPISLLIAALKALLVVLYFMRLRFDTSLNRMASVIGIFWLGILVSLVLSDYLSRNWIFLPGYWPGH